MKKLSRKKLVSKLDKIFSEYIRNRDGICVQCGSINNLTCGHLFSRINYSTRWDEENCWCQCCGCNLRHEHEFEPFRRFVEGKIGRDKYDLLYQRHIQISKIRDYQLEEKIKYYQSLNNILLHPNR